MKTFATAQDVLRNARECHHLAGEAYRQLKQEIKDERAGRLLEHLCQHEKKMEEDLSRYEQCAPKAILHTWVQYTPAQFPRDIVGQSRVTSMSTVQDINEMGQQVDAYLLGLFNDVTAVAATDELKDVFQNLKDREMDEKHRLTQAQNSLWGR